MQNDIYCITHKSELGIGKCKIDPTGGDFTEVTKVLLVKRLDSRFK